MTAPGHGPLSEKRSRTVHGILGAAMQIVMEEGVAGLSMSAIAERAGVSRQTLYSYYPDVEAVLAGVVAMGDEGDAELIERLQDENDARLALGSFVDAMVATAASGHPSPTALTVALPVTLRRALAEHAQQTERLVVELLRRGQEDGSFRADLDPALDGRLLFRATLAVAELAAEPGMDQQRMAQHLKTALLRAVAAEDPTPAGG